MSAIHPTHRNNFLSRFWHFFRLFRRKGETLDTIHSWAWESNPKFYDWLCRKPK